MLESNYLRVGAELRYAPLGRCLICTHGINGNVKDRHLTHNERQVKLARFMRGITDDQEEVDVLRQIASQETARLHAVKELLPTPI
ncbi:Hypothetical protein POVN_LOCUS688 [uncultured virus]|nr:Hypothetical protein POVN_LOCUS688 [uncultured virus]